MRLSSLSLVATVIATPLAAQQVLQITPQPMSNDLHQIAIIGEDDRFGVDELPDDASYLREVFRLSNVSAYGSN